MKRFDKDIMDNFIAVIRINNYARNCAKAPPAVVVFDEYMVLSIFLDDKWIGQKPVFGIGYSFSLRKFNIRPEFSRIGYAPALILLQYLFFNEHVCMQHDALADVVCGLPYIWIFVKYPRDRLVIFCLD